MARVVFWGRRNGASKASVTRDTRLRVSQLKRIRGGIRRTSEPFLVKGPVWSDFRTIDYAGESE